MGVLKCGYQTPKLSLNSQRETVNVADAATPTRFTVSLQGPKKKKRGGSFILPPEKAVGSCGSRVGKGRLVQALLGDSESISWKSLHTRLCQVHAWYLNDKKNFDILHKRQEVCNEAFITHFIQMEHAAVASKRAKCCCRYFGVKKKGWHYWWIYEFFFFSCL